LARDHTHCPLEAKRHQTLGSHAESGLIQVRAAAKCFEDRVLIDRTKGGRLAMKPTVTWVLVADGKRAQLYRNAGPDHGLERVANGSFESHLPPTHSGALMTDRPARVQESAAPARHAIEPKTDPRRALKTAFAADLARKLEDGLVKGACQRIVLVAPPRIMGELREHLSARGRAAVAGEIVKDLTRLNLPDLTKQVGTVLAI
jgi:protein required for attachment to host cells